MVEAVRREVELSRVRMAGDRPPEIHLGSRFSIKRPREDIVTNTRGNQGREPGIATLRSVPCSCRAHRLITRFPALDQLDTAGPRRLRSVLLATPLSQVREIVLLLLTTAPFVTGPHGHPQSVLGEEWFQRLQSVFWRIVFRVEDADERVKSGEMNLLRPRRILFRGIYGGRLVHKIRFFRYPDVDLRTVVRRRGGS